MNIENKMENWEEDATVQKWFKQVGKERTIKNYRREFPQFLEFVNVEPSAIIKQRLEQLATTDNQKRHYWENKFVEYKHKLEKSGLRKNTIHGYLRTVRSFFSHNNVPLLLNRSETKISPQNRNDRVSKKWVPTNEEVRQLYRMANTARDRALLLVLAQSGFSEVDVASMNIEDFPFYNESGSWQIPITDDLYHERLRTKTDMPQQTCVSREALAEIKVMLQQRDFPQSGALFVSFRGKRLGVREINMAITNIVEKAFDGKAKLWKTKNLRDTFMNGLWQAKLTQELKDAFVGHKRQGAKDNYKPTSETILKAYAEAFKHLSINGYASESRKIAELEKKTMKELSGLAKVIAQQQQTITELKDYVVNLDKAISEKQNKEFTAMYLEVKQQLEQQQNQINKLMLLIEKKQS